jgi:hypothetical protein
VEQEGGKALAMERQQENNLPRDARDAQEIIRFATE